MTPEAIAAAQEVLQNPDRVYSGQEYRKVIADLIAPDVVPEPAPNPFVDKWAAW